MPVPECRHHPAEFVPANLATIDDDCRHTMLLVGIAVDGATQDQAIVQLRSVPGILNVAISSAADCSGRA
jgi:pyocin large subunit-like protein